MMNLLLCLLQCVEPAVYPSPRPASSSLRAEVLIQESDTTFSTQCSAQNLKHMDDEELMTITHIK